MLSVRWIDSNFMAGLTWLNPAMHNLRMNITGVVDSRHKAPGMTIKGKTAPPECV
jgi:hypothetical protein